MKNSILTRILSLALAAIMVTGVMTACGSEPGGDQPTSDSASPDEAAITETSVALCADVDYISVPDDKSELAQELKLTVDGTEISGSLTADDITLKDAFEGMKVSKLSNDNNSITLTVSGSPVIADDSAATGCYGTMEFSGKPFGSEDAITKRVMLASLGSEEAPEGGYFYPFFESALENDGFYELTVTLQPRCAVFSENFGKNSITLGNDFEGADILSLEKDPDNENYRNLVLKVAKQPEDENGYFYIGSITLEKDSLTDKNGKTNPEAVTMSRSYSVESMGKALDASDVKVIKGIVGGFGNTTFGTIFGVVKGIGSAASFGYQVLGWFGVVPTESSRHQDEMDKLNEIQQQLRELNSRLDEIDSTLERQTDMLYAIERDQKETALANFDTSFSAMISCISDIEYALNKKNAKKINTLLKSFDGVEVNSKEEALDALNKMAVKISKLPASNIDTIADKVKLLESSYREVATAMQNKPSNPINRFLQLCAINDNFTTTSLIEKQLYSLDIEVHLRKALGLLSFFKGYDANDANIKLADSVYYPDFESVTTDKNGNPYCYLSGSYVYMTGEVTSFIYNPMKNNRLSQYIFLGKTDAERFAARMHGRTLKEEMMFAGFSEEKMNETTKLDPLVNPNKSGTENRKVGGLGFYYEKMGADKFNKTDEYYRIPNTLTKKAGYPSSNNFQSVPSYSKDGGAFAVISLPMLWDDTKLNGGLGTEGVFLSKHDWEAGGQGWYVCYPTLTLAKAS